MTYQATIHFNETIHLITNLGDTRLTNPQHLVIQLDAPNTKSAQQAVRNRWQKIRQQLPQASAPNLLDLQEATPRCPRCGATELSFCKH